MKLQWLSTSGRIFAALLFCLHLSCLMVLASPQKEEIEKAKALYQQAKDQHELGNYEASIQIVKQGIEIYKNGYKHKEIIDGISNYSRKLEKAEEKNPAGSMSRWYLSTLETYLSDENLNQKREHETTLDKYSRISESRKKDSEKAQSVYDTQYKLLKEKQKQEIDQITSQLLQGRNIEKFKQKIMEELAQGRIPDMNESANELYQGIDKEKFKQDITKKLVEDKMPYLIAIEMQKTSHAIDSAHEIIALSGDYQKAFHQFIETLSAEKETIGYVIGYIPEKQQLEFLSTKKKNLDAFLSLVTKHLPGDPEAINAAFDTWISRKGLVLEAQRQFQDAVAYADDPESIMIFQELSQVREELSSLVLSVQDQADKEEKKLQIDELKKEKERLEFKLRLSNPAYALKTQIDDADGRKIASLLPKGTVLLDFARVNMFNFDPSDEKEESWQPPHYIVFALHAGSGERLTMIDLGEAEKIDDSISDFKLHLKTKIHLSKEGDGLNEKAQNLYNLVFAPIIKTLGNTKEIYISPDGNLNLIPFEVMQNSKGRYLIEDYTFNYLAASREMLGFGQIKGESGKSVIIGDPDFDLEDEIQPHKAPTDSDGSSNYVAQRSIRMSGLHFERLINTRKEVMAIHALLGGENAFLYTDNKATETALFNHKAPRILHLATHGFFLNDQDHGSSDDRGSIIQMNTPTKSTHTNDSIENPLHRSGIALAGANTTLKSQTQQRSTGIVTAEKILGLKLRGTEMVVLSACETGVGQVESGEGVFGLRRTFFQAGIQSLVMSLWSVPDKETQELMVQFYKNIAAGMKRNQALRQAALKQMQIVTERYGYSHPFYWGAFVFQGES